jgi:hypothetical protein
LHRLYKLREELGIDQAMMSHLLKLDVEDYESGLRPVWVNQQWTQDALDIAAFHGLSPEEIWDDGAVERRELEGRSVAEAMLMRSPCYGHPSSRTP